MKLKVLLLIIYSIVCPCPDTDTRCLRCGGDRCLNCIDSFANSSGICVSVLNKIDNCLSYRSDGDCLECSYRYRVNSNGQCVPIEIEDCL